MIQKILYLGDTNLDTSARYMAGCLKHLKLPFDYLPSQQKPGAGFLKKNYALYILSDYPSANFSKKQLSHLTQAVKNGSSLLMIGGWGSFRGVDGNYGNTPLSKALPVKCLKSDDRKQGAGSYRIHPYQQNGFFKNLNFKKAPGICGYNKTTAKTNTKSLLSVQTLSFNKTAQKPSITQTDPLLVLGHYGQGRTAALTTDLAPHWSGGLIDWGTKRIKIKTQKNIQIEVGNDYITFIRSLLQLLLKK